MIRIESGLVSLFYHRMLGYSKGRQPAVLIRKMSETFVTSEGHASNTEQQKRNSTVAVPPDSASNSSGQAFNLVFVDIPSVSDMVLTSVDFLLLPLRIGLAATLLVIQVFSTCPISLCSNGGNSDSIKKCSIV